ncbi:DUF4194 domain-containing protein [Massilia sp. W12]|uniref:DUF4194 domain-containing protein n=1 Tax=Massilia sp. W12 TaxID=3126507 RepID=UPI0030CAA47A
MDYLDEEYLPPAPPAQADLSMLMIALLKGVLYRESEETQWNSLLQLQAQVREYSAILNLDLILDEAEGYAFLKSRPEPGPDDPAPRLPRLMTRRSLTYAVSLTLAILRKKMAEADASGGDTRLVLSLTEIADLLRVFLPDGPNETKMLGQIEATMNKVVELGFARKLKNASGNQDHFEVRRILKAFVDAQWLSEFDAKLEQYRTALSSEKESGNG